MPSGYSMAMMPKPKPDQVIRHEIALSRPMQESVDQFVVAHSFQSISTPIVDLMKDVSGMIVLLSVVAAIGYKFDFISTGADTMEDVITQFRQQRDIAKQNLATAEILASSVGATLDRGVESLLDYILQRN